MKKIMFNDRYGLTDAVLNGKKTMTRRNAEALNHPLVTDISEWGIDDKGKAHVMVTYSTGLKEAVYPIYQPGEEVSIGQKYIDLKDDDAFYEALQKADPSFPLECIKYEKGCYNKMFVKAAWMPHRIRITDVSYERIQNISEMDILCEGVYYYNCGIDSGYTTKGLGYNFPTARDAFANLIDKISGGGTWNRNSWVFVYEFELLK